MNTNDSDGGAGFKPESVSQSIRFRLLLAVKLCVGNNQSESKERENQPAFNANSDIKSSGEWGSCFHEHPPVPSAIIAGDHKGFVSFSSLACEDAAASSIFGEAGNMER